MSFTYQNGCTGQSSSRCGSRCGNLSDFIGPYEDWKDIAHRAIRNERDANEAWKVMAHREMRNAKLYLAEADKDNDDSDEMHRDATMKFIVALKAAMIARETGESMEYMENIDVRNASKFIDYVIAMEARKMGRYREDRDASGGFGYTSDATGYTSGASCAAGYTSGTGYTSGASGYTSGATGYASRHDTDVLSINRYVYPWIHEHRRTKSTRDISDAVMHKVLQIVAPVQCVPRIFTPEDNWNFMEIFTTIQQMLEKCKRLLFLHKKTNVGSMKLNRCTDLNIFIEVLQRLANYCYATYGLSKGDASFARTIILDFKSNGLIQFIIDVGHMHCIYGEKSLYGYPMSYFPVQRHNFFAVIHSHMKELNTQLSKLSFLSLVKALFQILRQSLYMEYSEPKFEPGHETEIYRRYIDAVYDLNSQLYNNADVWDIRVLCNTYTSAVYTKRQSYVHKDVVDEVDEVDVVDDVDVVDVVDDVDTSDGLRAPPPSMSLGDELKELTLPDMQSTAYDEYVHVVAETAEVMHLRTSPLPILMSGQSDEFEQARQIPFQPIVIELNPMSKTARKNQTRRNQRHHRAVTAGATF